MLSHGPRWWVVASTFLSAGAGDFPVASFQDREEAVERYAAWEHGTGKFREPADRNVDATKADGNEETCLLVLKRRPVAAVQTGGGAPPSTAERSATGHRPSPPLYGVRHAYGFVWPFDDN